MKPSKNMEYYMHLTTSNEISFSVHLCYQNDQIKTRNK